MQTSPANILLNVSKGMKSDDTAQKTTTPRCFLVFEGAIR